MRVLADGKVKFTILTTSPANPDAPTAAELNAGIDLSCKVLSEGFEFGPTDSETIDEAALCDEGSAEALGRSNYQSSFTLWRYFLEAGGFDPTEDAGFEAVKYKGATLWAYSRKTDKKATEDWAAEDEIRFGAEITNDNPQDQAGGWVKYRVPCKVQRGYPFIEVAAA